jgi:hypothetical protein
LEIGPAEGFASRDEVLAAFRDIGSWNGRAANYLPALAARLFGLNLALIGAVGGCGSWRRGRRRVRCVAWCGRTGQRHTSWGPRRWSSRPRTRSGP